LASSSSDRHCRPCNAFEQQAQRADCVDVRQRAKTRDEDHKSGVAGPGDAALTSVLMINEGAGFLPRAILADRDAYSPIAQLDKARALTGLADSSSRCRRKRVR
jgi:hypothetical protein